MGPCIWHEILDPSQGGPTCLLIMYEVASGIFGCKFALQGQITCCYVETLGCQTCFRIYFFIKNFLLYFFIPI